MRYSPMGYFSYAGDPTIRHSTFGLVVFIIIATVIIVAFVTCSISVIRYVCCSEGMRHRLGSVSEEIQMTDVTQHVEISIASTSETEHSRGEVVVPIGH